MDKLLLYILRSSVVRPFLVSWMANNGSSLHNDLFLFSILLSPENHIRPQGYHEEWLPKYTEFDFFRLFRMTQEGVQKLLRYIGPALRKMYSGGEQPISEEKKVLMALWYLGKHEVYLSVSDKFNVALSAAHKAVNDVINLLVELQYTFIIWPTRIETATVVEGFLARANIPGVVGAIDVCNIEFKPPAEQHNSYIDRKQNYSIKLQAICTANKIFTNILVGWPGSVHDSRIFQNSEIYRKVVNNVQREKYFPTLEHHLVADSAYPLLDFTLTPFRDNGNLAVWQRRFNFLLSRTRIVIEHAFGILKCRWRILMYVNVYSVERAVKIIVACCVLHNFCYLNSEEWNEDILPQDDDNEEYDGPDENNFAINKRWRIANALL